MEKLFLEHPWIIILILLWTIPWKGAALWRAARNGQLGWFLTLLIINSLAILDIIYLLLFSAPDVEQEKPGQDEVRQARMQRYREQQTKKRELEQQIEKQQETSARQPSELTARKRPTII